MLDVNVNVQNAVKKDIETVDIVCDGHAWDVAYKLFGGKTKPTHKSLPQAALSIVKCILLDV